MEYKLKQSFDAWCDRLCKCILTAPTFFRAAVMDIAGMKGLDAGRAGALAAESGWEGQGWGRRLSEVDDTATAAAAATLPDAMPTFTPRAASFDNTQYPGLDYNLTNAPVRPSNGMDWGMLRWSQDWFSLHGPPKLSFLSRSLLSSSSLVALSARQHGHLLGPGRYICTRRMRL